MDQFDGYLFAAVRADEFFLLAANNAPAVAALAAAMAAATAAAMAAVMAAMAAASNSNIPAVGTREMAAVCTLKSNSQTVPVR